jgi:hypothetical protein
MPHRDLRAQAFYGKAECVALLKADPEHPTVEISFVVDDGNATPLPSVPSSHNATTKAAATAKTATAAEAPPTTANAGPSRDPGSDDETPPAVPPRTSAPPSDDAPKAKRKVINKHFKIGVPQTVKLTRSEEGLGVKLEEREGGSVYVGSSSPCKQRDVVVNRVSDHVFFHASDHIDRLEFNCLQKARCGLRLRLRFESLGSRGHR